MSLGFFMALLGSSGVSPLAVKYEDLSFVYHEDSTNVLYEG